MQKQSFIDHQALAADFKVGDYVQKIAPSRGKEYAIPLVGRVDAVHTGIGFVDVAFPWGSDRISPEYLKRLDGAPPVVTDFLDSYERRKNGSVSLITKISSLHLNAVGEVYETALQMREVGIKERDAYHKMASRWSSEYGLGVIQEAISFAYEPSLKVAIYWKERGRQYVPSKEERESGVLKCPRCKVEMGRTVYKKRMKLYACPECLFLIKPCDLIDPSQKSEEEECVDDDGLEFSNPNNAFNEWL